VVLKPETVLPEGTRLVSAKPDDGFSDDVNDAADDDGLGPAAFAYASDDDDADSEDDDNGPVEAHDPWGLSLQVRDFLLFIGGRRQKSLSC